MSLLKIAQGILLLLSAFPALAQSVAGGSIDTSDLMTRAEAQASLTVLNSEIAEARSQLSLACRPSVDVPPTEAVGGSPGSGNACRLANAVQPRSSRAGVVPTDQTGHYFITWSTPLPTAPVTLPIPILPTGATQPIVCLPSSSTTTGATGRCWLARTLPATIALASSLVSYDVFGSPASAINVQVLAIPITQ